jgi:hypothetical protein
MPRPSPQDVPAPFGVYRNRLPGSFMNQAPARNTEQAKNDMMLRWVYSF